MKYEIGWFIQKVFLRMIMNQSPHKMTQKSQHGWVHGHFIHRYTLRYSTTAAPVWGLAENLNSTDYQHESEYEAKNQAEHQII